MAGQTVSFAVCHLGFAVVWHLAKPGIDGLVSVPREPMTDKLD